MEEYFRRVEFGMANLQRRRRHSLSCHTEELRAIDEQKSGIRCREKPRRSSTSSCRRAEMLPAMPEQAMEFLSRTWSSCSSDLRQILSPACSSHQLPGQLGSASAAPEDPDPAAADEVTKNEDEDEEKKHHPDTVRLEPGRGQQSSDETRGQGVVVVARGTQPRPPLPRRRNKLTQPTSTWKLNAGHMRANLRGFLLSAVSVTGSQQQRRRRDERRLHAAQAHAAVSVAQLAAAVAGMVSACELRPPPTAARSGGGPDDNQQAARDSSRMGAVLSSAATLVATVCAEAAGAAEGGRANRARVASAVRAGRESRSPADLLALTATAATALRGAAALELRAAADVRRTGGTNDSASIGAILQKGTTLRVCLPCRVRVRTVAIFHHGSVVLLRLGKKLIRGAFVTYKEYEVVAVSSGGEAVAEGQSLFPLSLSTAGGATVQLLFEHQAHCNVWMASVQGMLSERIKKAQTPPSTDDAYVVA